MNTPTNTFGVRNAAVAASTGGLMVTPELIVGTSIAAVAVMGTAVIG
jgi:hypothetical protein